jgi:hypothetical protein
MLPVVIGPVAAIGPVTAMVPAAIEPVIHAALKPEITHIVPMTTTADTPITIVVIGLDLAQTITLFFL